MALAFNLSLEAIKKNVIMIEGKRIS